MKLNLNIEYEKSDNYKYENKFGGESHIEDVLIILVDQSPIVFDYLPQSMPENQDGTADRLSYSWNNTTYEWIPDVCLISL